jgi:hypothetical protein
VSTVRLRDFSRNFGEEEGTVLCQVGEKEEGQVGGTIEESSTQDSGCFCRHFGSIEQI